MPLLRGSSTTSVVSSDAESYMSNDISQTGDDAWPSSETSSSSGVVTHYTEATIFYPEDAFV
eukprot:7621113-Karenia_brevis.AAC.1